MATAHALVPKVKDHLTLALPGCGTWGQVKEKPELWPWRRAQTGGGDVCVPPLSIESSEWSTSGASEALKEHRGGRRLIRRFQKPCLEQRQREGQVCSLEKPELGAEGEKAEGQMRLNMSITRGPVDPAGCVGSPLLIIRS